MNMKEQNMQKDPVEMLGEVAQVGAPPFLLTRVRQRIADLQQRVPAKWVFATALSVAVIFIMNICLVAGRQPAEENRDSKELAAAMNLFPQNALYR